VKDRRAQKLVEHAEDQAAVDQPGVVLISVPRLPAAGEVPLFRFEERQVKAHRVVWAAAEAAVVDPSFELQLNALSQLGPRGEPGLESQQSLDRGKGQSGAEELNGVADHLALNMERFLRNTLEERSIRERAMKSSLIL